jgi:hypothetical protein
MGLADAGAGTPFSRRGRDLSYRGYRLRQEQNLGWSVEPLEGGVQKSGQQSGQWGGFVTPPSSLADVKALIDWRLDQAA